MLFRLRHSSVSGFSGRASIVACHAAFPIPPSSNRTCGFPASGSPESSRLRHSQVSQIHQSQVLKMLVQAERLAIGPGGRIHGFCPLACVPFSDHPFLDSSSIFFSFSAIFSDHWLSRALFKSTSKFSSGLSIRII